LPFDLQPTDEQRVLQETLHDFAAEALRPSARDCESAKQTSEEIFRQAHEIGVTAPLAEEYGGAGLFDAVTHCIVAEELAWGDPGIAYYLVGSGLSSVVVGLAGSDKQKQTHLPAFGDASPVKSFVAIGEKVAVGDLESLETTIDGDKVSGTKYGVLNAVDASLGVVVGRSGDELAAVLLDGSNDLDIVKPEDKLGLEAAPTSVVNFAVAGDPIPQSPELTQAILRTKLMTGALAVGCARASLEYASQYAIEREAFGKPIGAFQAISFKIADMAIEVDAARLSVWRAAWKIDRGEATLSDIAEANGQALRTAVLCGDDGVQVLGGHGYIRDHPVEKWFRDAVTLSVFDAPDAVGDMMVARGVSA
jgi:alkylation response protein AidB-like acyl-CoA dehydrogenase